MTDDNSFVLGHLCYHWLSFCTHESSLLRVFAWFCCCWLFAFVYFILFFGLCLLVFSFALYFWWIGFHSWFYLKGFSSSYDTNINMVRGPEIILHTWLHIPIPILALYPLYTMQKSILDPIPIPTRYEEEKKKKKKPQEKKNPKRRTILICAKINTSPKLCMT